MLGLHEAAGTSKDTGSSLQQMSLWRVLPHGGADPDAGRQPQSPQAHQCTGCLVLGSRSCTAVLQSSCRLSCIMLTDQAFAAAGWLDCLMLTNELA